MSASVSGRAVPGRRPLLGRRTRSDLMWAAVMLAPLLIGLGVFFLGPVVATFVYTFTAWGEFGSRGWAGLANYRQLFQDPDLGHAFLNTFIYTGLAVPISLVLGILIAVLLNHPIRGRGVYRTLYFLPVVTMPAAVALVWKWVYNGQYGILNAGLARFGIHGPDWLTDPRTALLAMILVGIWSSLGYNMILFTSGLQGIPSIYYEAASIDGARSWSRLRHVTIPLLTPTIFFAAVIGCINGFQLFDLVYLMIGPNSPVLQNTETVVFLFYQDAFINGDKGYAATIAFALFLLILTFTLLQFRLQRRWVHYQ